LAFSISFTTLWSAAFTQWLFHLLLKFTVSLEKLKCVPHIKLHM
jgi:hypothetical protein